MLLKDNCSGLERPDIMATETLKLAQCGRGASSPEQTSVFAADEFVLLRATRAMIQ